MEAPGAPKTYTVQEYFELEKTSELRHEFYRGEIFAMAGATLNHNEIVQNTAFALRDHFRPKGCRIFTESVKLEVIRDVYYPYPDILLTCHPDDLRAQYVVQHPSLIVEVLSDSTADHDRGFKWQHYQQTPSLKHYLLISQHEYRAELYSRIVDFWKYEVFTQPDQRITFEHLDFELSLSEIYQNVVFDEAEQ